jgi:hypothetical protein
MTLSNSVPPVGWTLPAFISTASEEVQNSFNVLVRTLSPPHGLPALQLATSGLVRCLVSAAKFIPTPNEKLTKLVEGMQELEMLLATELVSAGRATAVSELAGTKTRHPEWNWLAEIGRSSSHLLAETYLGFQLLIAIDQTKRLKHSQVKRAKDLRKEEDVTEKELTIFIHGEMPDQFLGQSWALNLIRAWRIVLKAYSEDAEPPKPTSRERLASQMLSATMHGSTQVRAGALSHRQLSPRQHAEATTAIWRGICEDTLSGALGVMAVVSTFSVDVIAELPIQHSTLESDWEVTIDVEAGTLLVDYRSLVPEASKPLSSCVPSTFVSVRPLPLALSKNLRTRLLQYPEAQLLRDLYPTDPAPDPAGPIFRSPDGIQPTWGRLRNSTSRVLRHLGLDAFVVGAVTGDFTIVPRSKWYYSSISAGEIEHGFKALYASLGWGEPVAIEHKLNFGCQVVPQEAAIKALDKQLVQDLQDAAPGRNTAAALLMKFHNCYMHLLGSRMSLLLALRETKEFNVLANFDQEEDDWIPIHDKNVPNDIGYMAVPTCNFLRETIRAHRRHCHAMHARLQTLGLGNSDLARWCLQVIRKSKVPLLCIAENTDLLRPLATIDFMTRAEGGVVLPPDFGRKAMENLLRGERLRSSDIDSVLRHRLAGQGHTNATSDFNPGDLLLRFEFSMKNITSRLYGSVVFGLSKE